MDDAPRRPRSTETIDRAGGRPSIEHQLCTSRCTARGQHLREPLPTGAASLRACAITLPDGAGSTVTITVTAATTPWCLQNNHTSHVLEGTGAQVQIVFGAGITSFGTSSNMAGAS